MRLIDLETTAIIKYLASGIKNVHLLDIRHIPTNTIVYSRHVI